MASDERHVYGSRPVGALVPRITRPVFRRRAPAAAQLLADWPSIIGPALAAVTTPRRFAAGSLTIACSGPIAMELQHLSGEVMARINAHLGQPVVSALRFVQTATAASLPPMPPAPSAADKAAVEASVSALPEGELRAALIALGHALRAGATPSTSPRRKR